MKKDMNMYIGTKPQGTLLTILCFEYRQGKRQKNLFALCRCDCGKEKWIHWSNIKSGSSTSCGCKCGAALGKARVERTLAAKGKAKAILSFSSENPGYTLQAIGDEVGVTREYVRQTLNKYAFPRPSTVRRTLMSVNSENTRLRAYITAMGLPVPEFAIE